MATVLRPDYGCDAEALAELGLFEEKEAEDAKGIPDRRYFGNLQDIAPGTLLDYVKQRHLARRAGDHTDFRIGDEKGLYSWATRKPFPTPGGGKTLLIQQPMHSHKYKDFSGTIPAGRYGAGRVSVEQSGKVLVTSVSPSAVHFTLSSGKYPERYVLVKPDSPKFRDKDWLLINKTPLEQLPYEKVHYKKIPSSDVDAFIDKMQSGDSLEAKLDGASSLVKVLKDGVEIMSYRKSKVTNRPIVHTEKVLRGLPKMNIPPELVGTVLKGELYGQRDSGEVVPAQELGGLLNSKLEKSLGDQKSRNVRLRNMIYDIQQMGSKHVDWRQTPRGDRRKMIEQVLRHLPADVFHASDEAANPEDAKKLWSSIRGGTHPLTNEGAVIWPARGAPMKSKFFDDNDVHITGMFPGKGKYEGLGAGGLTYALEPGGKTVGEIGSGFTDELRQEIFKNPSDYVGRVARIRSQEQHPSGAHRSPSFLAFHEDYPQAKVASVLSRGGLGCTLEDMDLLGITKKADDYTSTEELLSQLVEMLHETKELSAVATKQADIAGYGITIDRPKGHQKTFQTLNGPMTQTYPVDYGYFNDFINPDDNDGLDVFVGSGGANHGRFMKGQTLTGQWQPDERKWYSGLTDDELASVKKFFTEQHADLIQDFHTFQTPEELLADIRALAAQEKTKNKD